MEVAQTQKFDKKAMQTTVTVPVRGEQDVTPYWATWLLYKPQAHAIEPFEVRKQTRLDNQVRNQ